MSEIKNGRLGLYGVKHSKCNRMISLRSKGFLREVQQITEHSASRPHTIYREFIVRCNLKVNISRSSIVNQ